MAAFGDLSSAAVISSLDGQRQADVTAANELKVNVAAIPLPAGAATEATLLTRATEATVASILAQLDVALSTRASQATVASILALLTAALDTTLSSRASEATLATRASEATVVSILAQLDVALSTRASQATVASILAQLDVALSTRAADRTTAAAPFSTRLSDGAAFYEATKTGQLPAALVGGRLDTNLGAWLGATTPTVGLKASAASIPVVIASDQPLVSKASTSTVTAVTGSAASFTLLAANANRLGATIYNDTNRVLTLKLGATASATSFTTKLSASGGYYEVPFNYTGIIDGIHAAGVSGDDLVTELTA